MDSYSKCSSVTSHHATVMIYLANQNTHGERQEGANRNEVWQQHVERCYFTLEINTFLLTFCLYLKKSTIQSFDLNHFESDIYFWIIFSGNFFCFPAIFHHIVSPVSSSYYPSKDKMPFVLRSSFTLRIDDESYQLTHKLDDAQRHTANSACTRRIKYKVTRETQVCLFSFVCLLCYSLML